MVILPPSPGKSFITFTAENKEELSEATQEFIDAIYQHNGRTVPSQLRESFSQGEAGNTSLQVLEALLNSIDPDSGYEDWLHCGMAIYHETKGSDEGLALFDRWSRTGSKYKGIKEIEAKWRSFCLDGPKPVTIGTLIKMAKDGADVAAPAIGNEDFKSCECEVVPQNPATPEKALKSKNPLDRYSLLGMSQVVKNQIVDQVYALQDIALMGQATVFYAAPNTGKTLLSMYLLMDSIMQKRVDSTKVYYINVDDTTDGLLDKLYVAEEYNFHMLAEGYRNFKAREFLLLVKGMISSSEAKGVIIFLDTLKKFTDLMDKKASSYFAETIRAFVMQGGTVIALAHTNKNPGRDGKRVPGGTSDILDDFDCAYVLDTVLQDADKNQKTVEFTNIKKRGNVASSVSYRYPLERDISYSELLLSVQEVDPEHLQIIKNNLETKTDVEVITSVETCIKDGINTKMKLAAETAERAKVSKRIALKVIDKYTGENPASHRWSFDVRDRGAKVYTLLERLSAPLASPTVADC